MSDNNLEIWKQVEQTNTRYTKTGNLGGRNQTSINGTYMVKSATEIFGPIGKGWGYEIVEERFDNGRTIFVNGEIQGVEQIHTIRLKLWYMQDGEKCSFEHFGHTPYVYWSHNFKSWNQDNDAPKKSLTDAIKKCLSMLGFSADIFLGMFEDEFYVQDRKSEASAEVEDERQQQVNEKREAFKNWFKEAQEKLNALSKAGALELNYKEALNKLNRDSQRVFLDPEPWRKALAGTYNKRMAQIKPIERVCDACGTPQKATSNDKCNECGSESLKPLQKNAAQ